ncbi:ABC transporter substrate-binding protein [Sulfitobacter sp. JBTF-M27]|uniref:ABC transporter substrate-binding protein n=1 Tax=Sulfitobacter sediminilitoris TaxID=2698830 RepID=A0A6P0CC32_9RHOB|nr:ABC transporter substrate-binding protein [Sulfitobacter sediminilitoris]NEK23749.1 ABC transporter substrate-binding protein [Sulfitobacter sediminilitoris]
MPKKIWKSAMAIVALAVSGAITPAIASAESSIVIGLQQEPTSLDPTSDATASIDGMLAQNVYESLTTVNQAGEVLPQLAESWTVSDDGLNYTFTLVKGATYHDGTAFDAQDVVFSFDRAMAEDSVNPSKGLFKSIESVSAVDSGTVEIKLSKKDAFFLFNMAQGDASIVASESYETNNATPVGTGPFKYDSWTRGDKLVLAKNANHRNAGSVALDRVEFKFISDAAAASAALLSEEIDAFPGFPAPELLPQFEADPRFNVVVGSTEGEVILAMNNSKPPFNDVRVRRAINHAFDRDEIIDGAMYGQAVPIGSFYPPHGPAYVDLTSTYPHDTEQAKALFEEAGVAGSTMTLRVPPFPYATRSAEIIQAQLAEAGIDAKVENVEWGFWIDEIYKKQNYDMTIIAHTSPNDLGNFARGPKYFYGYDDADYNDLWNRISSEVDPEARNALLQEAQQYLTGQAVHGFLFQLPQLGVYKTGVDGFWPSRAVLFQPLAGVTMN